ncbi:MAG: serine/threonine protein kinase [Gemmatimonadaceae bacterium]|nr:serine/threonine protein kinase [Gemmatimonadaceae bacterium]
MARSPVGPIDPLFLDVQEALAGQYSLDRELGRGGMGVVYLAREVHLDRLVAIKLLPPERSAVPGLRERFLREARLAAKLSHPNIIPIHAVGEAADFVYFVMAFVDGVTLAERVRTRGPLPATEGARVWREAAWALAYAHAQGLVHRDVKPDNILLENATGRVLVADFGIAAAFDDAPDEGIVGTPEFMSPEQAMGESLDARSDLYGLGATAFFAFSGRFPFEGTTPTEVLAKQVTEPAPPLTSLGVGVPRRLSALVDRCLQKERQQRPESAQALAEQLGVALEHRREVPAALRAFVKRTGRLDGGGTLVGAFLVAPIAVVVSAALGSVAGFGTLALAGIVTPTAYLVMQARRLLRQGFAHQDLRPAFESEAERAREELAATGRSKPPGVFERLLPTTARVAGGVFAVGVASWILAPMLLGPRLGFAWINAVGVTPILAAGTAMLAKLTEFAMAGGRRDVDTEFWANRWTGRFGRFLFAVARRTLGKETPLSAVTHRATELSLGMAAEQLYESLPKPARQDLAELPAILKRLQEDAQALRLRHDELADALTAAGEAAAGEEYTDVREARDELHAKLGEAIGALEAIRLKLLRLHAGSLSVQHLTTHLGIAEDVSEQVERLIAAHREVDRALAFPRMPTPTPV